MKRPTQTLPPDPPLNVRRTQEVELIREHWVNGRLYGPGTVLCLAASCTVNLIEAGAARSVTSNDSATTGN